MKSPKVTVAGMTAIFLACALPAFSLDRQTRIRDEVCKLENDMDHAIIAHNNSFLEEHLAEEYQHTNYIGGTTNKKAELAFFASPDFTLTKASVDSCSVRVYGDIAIATGINNWAEASYRKTDISGLYRYTTVYLLRDGRWQIVVGHASKPR
jgi:Domain of unknown function (DUF4440)